MFFRNIHHLVAAIFPLLFATLPPLSLAADSNQAHYLDHRADPTWSITEPRGEVVNVDFTTDEGTWMSVDISPDGNWLVFDLLGHIYRLPVSGGDAESLTQSSGIALNFHPRFSPDGSEIVFVSDRAGQNNLWVMNADGSKPRIVFEDPVSRVTQPIWTPDGSEIIAVREFPTYSMHRRSARIWAFPVDHPTRAPRQIVGEFSGQQAYWPALSPDGESLYFMHSTFAEPLHGMQRYQHIRRIALNTGALEVVTMPEPHIWYKSEGPTELAPEISPDGRYMAFARRIDGATWTYRGHEVRGRTALWIRDLETGAERLLADPITYDMQNAHGMKNLRVLPGYAWAPDSESIVYSQGGKLRRVWLDDGDVETIPFTARVQRTASQQARWSRGINESDFEAKFIRWPDVTPDGSVAVFEAAGWIWRKDLPNGTPIKLLGDSPPQHLARQYMPDLSPDGSEVTFATWTNAGMGQVWRVSIDGGQPRQISDQPALYLNPAWSADGATVTAVRSAGVTAQGLMNGDLHGYELVSMQRNGKVTVLAPDAPALPMAPGPEGRLYFVESRELANVQTYLAEGRPPPDSHSVLVSVDPAAPGATREHLRFPAASEAAPSPSGDKVAYVEGFELQVAEMRHDTAIYREEQALVWDGPNQPFELIKEDPRRDVVRLSDGGAQYVRWLDDERLVYAAADRVVIHHVSTNTPTEFPVDLELSQKVPSGMVALSNARIVTLEDQGVVEEGTVLVKDARITCVGDCDTGDADRVINLDGATIIPGFVDVHAHGYFFVKYPVVGEQLPVTSLYLAYGVTTALDPAANSDAVFPIAEQVNAGRLPGPRFLSTGEHLMTDSPDTGPRDYAHAERIVRRLADRGATSIKIYLTPRRDQRQMYAEAARKLGLSVTNEGADFTFNVGSMLDGNTGFEHPMHQVPTWNDVAQFFGQTNAVYSATLIVAGASTWMEDYYQSRADVWNKPKLRRFMPWTYMTRLVNHTQRPKSEYTFPAMAETVADIIEAGGHGAIGGHGQTWGLDSHWEVWGYSEALEPIEALHMASMGGAYMAGIENDVGSIKNGKLADLIILDANPLEDIHNTTAIRYVMKNGVLYDDETLSEVWPEPVERPAPAWYREDVYRDDSRSIEQP